ncbi:MAG: hypothetical protein AAF226_18335 [Verrucomicrobiota bacterium]
MLGTFGQIRAEDGFVAPSDLGLPAAPVDLPDLFKPVQERSEFTQYQWKRSIPTTVFWVGELASPKNPVDNIASAWDGKWRTSFGGFDDPRRQNRVGYLPKGFVPTQNPFYIALPYNDITYTGTKSSAKTVVPWFDEVFYRKGRSVLKGRWLAIRYGNKICYGQWEDVGPFTTDDHAYVFGDSRPRTKGNGGAGLDVSPAIRDYLGFRYNVKCDWRFVEVEDVPDGPWKKWGRNNPFANSQGEDRTVSESLVMLHDLRDRLKGEEGEVSSAANDAGDSPE